MESYIQMSMNNVDTIGRNIFHKHLDVPIPSAIRAGYFDIDSI